MPPLAMAWVAPPWPLASVLEGWGEASQLVGATALVLALLHLALP